MTISVSPISQEIASHVRTTRTDPVYGFDHDVMMSVAGPGGYGPCRQCLRTFEEGERRLLFLYNPFGSSTGDYAGPIYIHEDACEPYAKAGAPDQIRELPLALFAYDEASHFVREHALSSDLDRALLELLSDERTAFVHIRNSEARCFIARVDAIENVALPDRVGLRDLSCTALDVGTQPSL